jgi:hypothetical protein
VVVAVLAVLTMDVPADDVVDVTVVRDRDVLAADSVHVIDRMRVARMRGIARNDVSGAELMLVDVIAVRMVEVPVVHVVDVILVSHGDVPAVLAMNVLVPIMNVPFF